MGVFGLQDPVPVILPLATVPLPVNSAKLPFLSPATKSRFTVALAGTGLEGTPIRTPWPVLFGELGIPVPEIEPSPVLLLAMNKRVLVLRTYPLGWLRCRDWRPTPLGKYWIHRIRNPVCTEDSQLRSMSPAWTYPLSWGQSYHHNQRRRLSKPRSRCVS